VAEFRTAPCERGVLDALVPGDIELSATLDGNAGSAELTVTPATLVALELAPLAPSLARGTSLALTATGTFSDLSTQDLSANVLWTSAASGVATVDNTPGQEGTLAGVAVGTAAITAELGTIEASTTATVTAATLVALEVAPLAPSLAAGLKRQFTAIGTFSDSSTQDLTASVTWASDDTLVATISNVTGSEGLMHGVAPGSAEISATLGAISASTTAGVTDATLLTLDIVPVAPSLAVGLTLPLEAYGTYSDSSTLDLTASVTWTSATPAIASVSNASGAEGLLSAVAVGSTEVAATLGAISRSTSVSVTTATLVALELSPQSPSLAAGLTQAFSVLGTFSDSSTQDLTTSVTWASDDTLVASISNAGGSEGLLTALTAGAAEISATLGAVSQSTTVTVSAATLVSLAITPPSPSLGLLQTLQLTATGTYTDSSTQDLTTSVTWSSDAPLTVQMSNAPGTQGRASALLIGSTQVRATLGAVSTSVPFVVHL